MSFRLWYGNPEFEHTHEQQAADELVRSLRAAFEASSEFCHLVLNVYCNGKDLDALVIKRDAVIIIEMKDCAQPIVGGANGDWKVSGQRDGTLNKNRRNPYQQVREYRFAVIDDLRDASPRFLAQQKAQKMRYDHVSGIVCVSPDLHPDSNIDIDSGRERWFHIVGLSQIQERVRQIRSPQISLTIAEAQKYIEEVLRCSPAAELTRAGDLSSASPEPKTSIETREYKLTFRFDTSLALAQTDVNLEEDLDRDQLAAVTNPADKLLILAGAGTGKTRALVYRAKWLLEKHKPDEILITTFTNKAADELYQRLYQMVGPAVSQIWIGTFHSICQRILRQHAKLLGYSEKFAIIDEDDQVEVLKRCLPKTPHIDAALFLRAYSYSRNVNQPISQIIEASRRFDIHATAQQCDQIAARYTARLKRADRMDFDDLLMNTVKLLEQFPNVREILQRRFRHILVDEYQDTNALQARILKLLGETSGVTVVGDDAQAIYSFRGADVGNILEFENDFPGAAVTKLELNHRSTPDILALANENIRHNRSQRQKTLRPADNRENHEKPWLCECKDMAQEAELVVSRVLELYGRGLSLNEMAVLFRSGWVTAHLEAALTAAQIPYEFFKQTPFFSKEHVKTILAYLRVADNPEDTISLGRIWRVDGKVDGSWFAQFETLAEKADRSVLAVAAEYANQPATGMKLLQMQRVKNVLQAIETLIDAGRSAPDLPTLIHYIVNEHYLTHLKRLRPTDWQECLLDLQALADLARHYKSIPELLEAISLEHIEVAGKHSSPGYPAEDKLTLTTIHGAKGREWRAVLVIGLSERVFPDPKVLSQDYTDEEERRLFHVAATRAREHLTLTVPLMIDSRRGPTAERPSRFVTELEGAVLDRIAISIE